MNPFREHLEFFRQFRRRFETTGAVAPSSRFLARALCAPLLRTEGPLRVLEVGPGTGAVTSEIVRRLTTDSRLDLVEINDEFAELLRKRFQTDGDFRSAAHCAEVHSCPLQDFAPRAEFDVLISGLPFNNFPPELVEELMDRCLALLAPGGEMAFFEYMFVRPVRQVISSRPVRNRLRAIEEILQSRFHEYRVQTDWVFINMPPAWVQHLRKPASDGSSPSGANRPEFAIDTPRVSIERNAHPA